MTTLIHSKIPMDSNGIFTMTPEDVGKWAKITKEQLGNNYTLIITPFDTNKIDGDALLINIDCKEYSYNELTEIIDKASMYDDLCR